jgi:Glycosyl transferase 4-like
MPCEQPPATSPVTTSRLLYVVTEDWAFLSHRLPMARAARDAGFEVHVATRVSDGAAAIEAERFTLHPVPFARGSLSPLTAVSTIAALRRVRRDGKPTLTHHVALQACVLGMLAMLGQRGACVNAFIGLGYLFTSDARKVQTVRALIGLLLRFLSNRKNCIALVQNSDDMAALILGFPRLELCSSPDRVLTSSTSHHSTSPAEQRLLDLSGGSLMTKVSARSLPRTGCVRTPDARLLITGTPDPANPASVTETEAKSWNDQPCIAWFGHVSDIAGFWAKAHVAAVLYLFTETDLVENTELFPYPNVAKHFGGIFLGHLLFANYFTVRERIPSFGIGSVIARVHAAGEQSLA